MLVDDSNRLEKALVCSPEKEYFMVSDTKEHNITESADRERTLSQHKKMVDVLSKSGVDVIDVEELVGHPNSVFTRDTAVLFKDGFLRVRMGLKSRRGEEEWMAENLKRAGYKEIGRIEKPGTLEGGDIKITEKVVFVGLSGRTNRDGIRQLENILSQYDVEIRTIKVPDKYLHLGGAVSVIDRNTFLCTGDIYDEEVFKGFKTIRVPESSFEGGNVIALGDGEVIAQRDDESTAKYLREVGIKVHSINLSEFLKGRGGPSCLVLPLERN